MNRFLSKTKLSLSFKLILGFLVVAIPSVAVMGGISFYALRDLANVNHQLQEISRSLEAVRALEAAFGRAVMPLSELVTFGGTDEAQSLAGLLDQVEGRLQTCADAACHGTARRPSEMAHSLVPYLQRIRERATILMRGGKLGTGTDKAQLLREINNLSQQAHRQLENMSLTLLLKVESLQRKSQEVNEGMRRLMVASMLSIVAIAILTAWFISRRLLRPVRELLAGTGHVKEGNLAYRVPILESDEFGELAQSFNAMAEEIHAHREHLEQSVQAKTMELKEAQASLVQSEKLASIGLLAAGVAHELNNPLTSILMNVNLLMEDVEDQPRLCDELKRISDDTVRCKRIIDDLRDFSRRHELDIDSCDLNGIVKIALGLIDRELKIHSIALIENFDPHLPLIPCDAGRVQQVLMNVFMNAVQAMPEGGTLRVGTRLREGLAEVSVQDTGRGIADEIKDKIFDPFFTTKPAGTGLGLSIVYRIMDEHGGNVRIENAPGGSIGPGLANGSGTIVRLLLPIEGTNRASPAAGPDPTSSGR